MAVAAQDVMNSPRPTAQELFDWLNNRMHRGEGWEVVNTGTGGLALRQSINAVSRTPEDAIFHAWTNEAVKNAKRAKAYPAEVILATCTECGASAVSPARMTTV